MLPICHNHLLQPQHHLPRPGDHTLWSHRKPPLLRTPAPIAIRSILHTDQNIIGSHHIRRQSPHDQHPRRTLQCSSRSQHNRRLRNHSLGLLHNLPPLRVLLSPLQSTSSLRRSPRCRWHRHHLLRLSHTDIHNIPLDMQIPRPLRVQPQGQSISHQPTLALRRAHHLAPAMTRVIRPWPLMTTM